jgi:hypothetical protein
LGDGRKNIKESKNEGHQQTTDINKQRKEEGRNGRRGGGGRKVREERISRRAKTKDINKQRKEGRKEGRQAGKEEGRTGGGTKEGRKEGRHLLLLVVQSLQVLVCPTPLQKSCPE